VLMPTGAGYALASNHTRAQTLTTVQTVESRFAFSCPRWCWTASPWLCLPSSVRCATLVGTHDLVSHIANVRHVLGATLYAAALMVRSFLFRVLSCSMS
jgi:hypothetical protein